jgi:hypothetical protein
MQIKLSLACLDSSRSAGEESERNENRTCQNIRKYHILLVVGKEIKYQTAEDLLVD